MIKEENHDENHDDSCVRWFWIRHAPVLARKRVSEGAREGAREGVSEGVSEGVFTGSNDVPANLDTTARTEIENLAASLAKLLPLRPDLWVSSGLTRARQTAQVLHEALHEALQDERRQSEQILNDAALNDEILNDAAFNEQNFGDWEGERYDEDKHRALWDAPATHRPPNGESFADLVCRVARAVERIEERIQKNIQKNIVERNRSEGREKTLTVVAVAHAGTIRAALAQALGLPPQRALSFVIDPLSLTRIDRFGHPRQDEQKDEQKTSKVTENVGEKIAVVRCVNVRQR